MIAAPTCEQQQKLRDLERRIRELEAELRRPPEESPPTAGEPLNWTPGRGLDFRGRGRDQARTREQGRLVRRQVVPRRHVEKWVAVYRMQPKKR